MKTGPSAPRVWLNPVVVWELLDRFVREPMDGGDGGGE